MAMMAQNMYLQWIAEEEANRHVQVRTYRDYYDGDFPEFMTDRQAEYLNIERKKGVGVNCCAVIVDTLVERLEVTGFTVSPKKGRRKTAMPMMPPAPTVPGEQDSSPAAQLSEILDGWWADNRMDGKQGWVHTAASRDAEGFVIVEYDQDEGRPCIENDYAFDGTSGVKIHMKPGTYHEIACASKRWSEMGAGGKMIQRLNLYFDNRIEYWMREDGRYELGWTPYMMEDEAVGVVALKDDMGNTYEAAVAWMTEDGTAAGKALGVPVFVFINKDDGTGRGISELDNAIPIQDAINKTFLDLIATADWTGFGMHWTDGILPNPVKVYPGAMIPVTPIQGNTSATVGELPPGDLSQLTGLFNNLVAVLSGISGTPQSRFAPSAVRPSEGTQKQDESALLAKVRDRQKTWGNAWEDVMMMCLKLERVYGDGSALPDTDGLVISTTWADTETRNEAEHMNALGVKADKLEVPVEQLWKEAGYTAAEIAAFKVIKQKAQARAMLSMARQAGAAASTQQQPAQQPMNGGDGEDANAGPPSNGNGKGGNMERQPMPMEMSRF